MNYELTVPDIACNHCTQRISNALGALTTELVVDVETKTVRIVSNQPVWKLLEAMKEAGYPASLKE